MWTLQIWRILQILWKLQILWRLEIQSRLIEARMDHKDHQLYEPQENCKYEIIDLQQIDKELG